MLECPGGAYCVNTSVLSPAACVPAAGALMLSNAELLAIDDEQTVASPQVLMPYCPANSTHFSDCPAGFWCPNITTAVACPLGTYCPEGSPLWSLCPGSSYCPNSSVAVQCPDGNYCPEGSAEPVSCSWLSVCHCDGGCEAPRFSAFVTGFGVLINAVVVIGTLAVTLSLLHKRYPQISAEIVSMLSRRTLSRAGTDSNSGISMSSANLQRQSGSQVEPLLNSEVADVEVARTLKRQNSSEAMRMQHRIDISFDNLGLRLKSGSKATLLRGVSGDLRSGRICAIMGPSGAGKTTFLSTLCGKASYGTRSGTMLLNGVEAELTDPAFKHLVGFCPQEDTMMRELTVRENIRFSALTRLPSSWSHKRQIDFAEAVIDLLSLGAVADQRIGDEAVRGVSGGQRKRVNIGMEMAADPSVLFLDEPTSGLDSAGSRSVVDALRSIADLGLTMALVLHQPRYEIFTQFDDLLLLGKGGCTVYMGPTSEAAAYFEREFGLVVEAHSNPADSFLDWVSGDFPREWRNKNPNIAAADFAKAWERTAAQHQNGATVGSTMVALEHPIAAVTGSLNSDEHAASSSPSSAKSLSVAVTSQLPKHEPQSSLRLIYLFFRRSLTQQWRKPSSFLLANILPLVSALFLAAVYIGQPAFSAPSPIQAFDGCPAEIGTTCQTCLFSSQDTILNRGIMTIIAVGLAAVSTFIPVFGSEKVVYWREASALPQPLHTVSYFVGKDLAQLPQSMLGPFIFTLTYDILAAPRASFWKYYLVFFVVYQCAAAFGYLISVLVPGSAAQLAGVTTIFGFATFAGAQPTLKEMLSRFVPLCYMPSISFMRYALEAIYSIEVETYRNIVALQGLDLDAVVEDTLGFDITTFAQNLTILGTFGLVVRGLALVAMLLKDREKKR